MHQLKIIIFGMIVGGLFGCSSMSKQECTLNNWAAMGERDGRQGLSKKRFSFYQRQCLEHGVSADQKSYFYGHTQGVNSYCTFENGYELGEKGGENTGICSHLKSKEFFRGHLAGKQSFEQKKQFQAQMNMHQKHHEETMQSRALFQERVLGNREKRACSWSPDCRIEDECVESKCSKTGKACTFDSHCTIEGSCISSKCQF